MFKILIILILFINLFAQSIDEKIAKLKSTPKNERYKLMNEIKLELSKLNEKQRVKIISELRSNHQQHDKISDFQHNIIQHNQFEKDHSVIQHNQLEKDHDFMETTHHQESVQVDKNEYLQQTEFKNKIQHGKHNK